MKHDNSKQRVLIFGAGQAGLHALMKLKNQYEIIGFVDNDPKKHGSIIAELTVFSPTEILSINFDKVIIVSEFAEDILKQLRSSKLAPICKVVTLPRRDTKASKFGVESPLYDVSISILLAIAAYLKQQQIFYFIDAGTLLGIYRDGALIPWDDDLDFGIHQKDTNKTIALLPGLLDKLEKITGHKWQSHTQISARSFGLIKTNDVRSIKVSVIEDDVSLPMIDLFVKYVSGDNMDYTLASRGMRLSSRHVLSLDSIEFKGQELQIPGDPEGYLESYYGDWRTPIKNWELSMLANTTVYHD
jgi:hypothetical protein